MKLGVLTNVVGKMPLDEALAYFKSMGIQMVEIGCGGYPGKDHCDPDVLLNDEAKLEEFKATIAKHGMAISALSCHGNPVHPNKEIAAEFEGRAVIAKCNVDDCDDIPMTYGIRSIPTILFFKNGELADRHVGVISKADLAAKIDALL